jgi:hypothetical protein
MNGFPLKTFWLKQLDIETPLKFNFDVDIATRSPSHQPRVDIF